MILTQSTAHTKFAFFGEHKPARSLVQVAALPKDAVIEIEAIAVKD